MRHARCAKQLMRWADMAIIDNDLARELKNIAEGQSFHDALRSELAKRNLSAQGAPDLSDCIQAMRESEIDEGAQP